MSARLKPVTEQAASCASSWLRPSTAGVARADWDEKAMRDEPHRPLMDHSGEANGWQVVDKTGFLNKESGRESESVRRDNSRTGQESGGILCIRCERPIEPPFWIESAPFPRNGSIPRARSGGGHPAGTPVFLASPPRWRAPLLTPVPALLVVGNTLSGYDELQSPAGGDAQRELPGTVPLAADSSPTTSAAEPQQPGKQKSTPREMRCETRRRSPPDMRRRGPRLLARMNSTVLSLRDRSGCAMLLDRWVSSRLFSMKSSLFCSPDTTRG